MRAGPMRHRVTVQSVSEDLDQYGQVVQTWTTIPSLAPDGKHAASVKFLYGRTLENSAQIKTEYHHHIVMRYFTGLLPSMRVLFQDKILYISSINDTDQLHRELQVRAQELPPAI